MFYTMHCGGLDVHWKHWTYILVNSNVPTANDVLVPETLIKKNKANAKAAEAAAADKVAARKASIDYIESMCL